ncbi:MAG: serine/threonine protein kinase [Lachnospiraceae bacterium]|nr:serine/threonine protein kinase [Lachnospiraceae bacterium]
MKDEVRAGNDDREMEEMLMRREYETGNSLKKIMERLPGRWYPGQRLHQGTMSEAWLLCGEGVSWKLVLKLAADEKSAWALRREIHFLRQLRGEGIPFLYHYKISSVMPWYTMPFYDGETLRERLDGRHSLTERETARIGRRLCKILDVLHRREEPIIYGDLKPENVILTPDGGVYLLDYGNAWYQGEEQGNIGFRGTPGYAAPECWHLERAGVGVDIFALGVMLHEMLEGGKPREHFGQYALENDAYKKRWQALINACTALNAEKRIRDVREADRQLKSLTIP